MSQAEDIRKLKDEVTKQGKTIEFLLNHFHLVPKEDELEQAAAIMFASGDTAALDSYLSRGGKILPKEAQS